MAQPIDISGYNTVFRSFVTFAEGALHTEKGAKSIANATILGGRTVSVAATNADKTGFSGGFHRSHAAEQANDATERELGFDKVIPVRAVMQNTGSSRTVSTRSSTPSSTTR